MSAVVSVSPKSVAPGPYLGFGLQPVRLCYYLLTEGSGRRVSIEHADDVAVHWTGGVLLEQTKSANSQNPVANFAVDLWKTFANWIDAIEPYEGEL